VVLVIIGVVLLAVAAVAVAVGLRQKRRWHAMLGTETSTAADLAAELATARELGAEFRRTVEITGSASPGPVGELTSELAGIPCVWFRYQIRRRYWATTTDSDGDTTREERTETVARRASEQPFRVTDATGSVLVRPDGLAIDRAERVVDQFTPAEDTDSVSFLGIRINRSQNDTIGYEREEWVVRSGTTLYVLGEVTQSNGELTIGKPAKGVHIISTCSEAEMRASAQKLQRISMWSALGAAALGVVLLIVGAVS
jgi:E3 Ubiquitin ligase